MKRSWIKLYVEMLDDMKLGPLPVWLKWRFVELLLVAAESDENGMLPPVTQMAWRLRVNEDDLLKSLGALREIGVVCPVGDRWKVTNFEKRQAAMSNTERVQEFRKRSGNKPETKRYTDDNEEDVTSSSSSSDSDSVSGSEEGGGAGEGDWIPETPAQASEHPDIQAFKAICGRIPGVRDYAIVIDTIRLLRAKHGAKLTETVKPCWLAWSTRKTKNGRQYDAASLVWLTEWAVNGQIPPVNGRETRRADDPGKYVEGDYAEFVEH